MDKQTIEQHIADAGPGGRLVVRFLDRMVPQLDENGEAVKDKTGETVHAHDPLGHVRVISGHVVELIETHLGLGTGPRGPIHNLIAFDDIHDVRPDPAEAPPAEEPAAETPAEPVPAEEVPT